MNWVESQVGQINRLKLVATFWERGRFMYHYFTDLDFRWWGSIACESSRIVECPKRIDWSVLPRFKNEEGSRIIISRILTSGSVDRLRAHYFKDLDFRWCGSTPCESTQFGCIGKRRREGLSKATRNRKSTWIQVCIITIKISENLNNVISIIISERDVSSIRFLRQTGFEIVF